MPGFCFTPYLIPHRLKLCPRPSLCLWKNQRCNVPLKMRSESRRRMGAGAGGGWDSLRRCQQRPWAFAHCQHGQVLAVTAAELPGKHNGHLWASPSPGQCVPVGSRACWVGCVRICGCEAFPLVTSPGLCANPSTQCYHCEPAHGQHGCAHTLGPRRLSAVPAAFGLGGSCQKYTTAPFCGFVSSGTRTASACYCHWGGDLVVRSKSERFCQDLKQGPLLLPHPSLAIWAALGYFLI